MMKEQTLDTGDIVLNYAENDHPGSALMIIHGITLSWLHLSVYIEPLSRTHHVFAPDLRGHGKSGHSRFGYPLEAYVDDVVHLMNQRVREPAVIIGASLGGLAAIGVAAALPAMTSGVVLLDPPLVMRDRPFDAISYSDVHAVISMMYQARTTNEAPADIARRIQQLIPEAPDDDALALAQASWRWTPWRSNTSWTVVCLTDSTLKTPSDASVVPLCFSTAKPHSVGWSAKPIWNCSRLWSRAARQYS